MHDPSDLPPFPWGVTYGGPCDLALAGEVLADVLIRAGMACRREPSAPGLMLLHAEQRARRHRILLGARLQRMGWNLEQRGGDLRIGCDYHLFGWYATIVLLLAAASLASIAASLAISHGVCSFGTWSRSLWVSNGLVLLGVALAPLVINLLGALGGRPAEVLWHELLGKIEERGGRLEPLGNGVTRRHSVALGGFFMLFLAQAIWWVADTLRRSALPLPPGGAGFVLVLEVLTFLLVVVLAFLLGRRGFNLRTYPILTGLATMVSVLLLLQGLLLPWWLTSRIDLAALGPRLPALGRVAAGVSLMLAAAFLYVFLRYALLSYNLMRLQLERLRRHRGRGLYRLATGGASPLPFQVVFVLSWLLLAGLIGASMLLVLLCAIQAAVPLSVRPELRLAETSATLVAAALGRPAGDPAVHLAVRAGWVLFGCAWAGLWIASAGQLARARHTARRRFDEAARRKSPAQAELAGRLETLRGGQAGLPPLRLAISPGGSLAARSHRFGFWPGERFVEIGEGWLAFPAEESAAVLAHEYAHHLLRHPGLDQLLRWLGRLSFAGDGFVRAVQDSFGHELQADEVARRSFGVSEGALAAALERIASRSAPLLHSANRLEDRSLADRLRDSLSLFAAQYSGGFPDLYYWHPVSAEQQERSGGSFPV